MHEHSPIYHKLLFLHRLNNTHCLLHQVKGNIYICGNYLIHKQSFYVCFLFHLLYMSVNYTYCFTEKFRLMICKPQIKAVAVSFGDL